jgi:hypothetical protein
VSNTRLFVVAGILVATGLLLLSPLASSEPDGLEKVASENGFAESAEGHALQDGPLAGYSVKGINDERWSNALSGLIGMLITFGVGLAVFALLRATRRRPGS